MLNAVSPNKIAAAYGGALLCVMMLVAARAHAQESRDCKTRSCWAAAIDGDFATALDSDLINSGGGGALRMGLQRELPSVVLIPEAMFAFRSLATDTPHNAAVTMLMLGGRMRLSAPVQPGLFVHVGAGRVAGDSRYAINDLVFDFGATVDVSVLSMIDVGVHAALNRTFGGQNGPLTFATFGLHAALVLEDKL